MPALSTFLRLAIQAIVLLGLAFPVPQLAAQTAGKGPSGLPLPRFVSLKSGKVNLRVGPGKQYAVEWRYLKSGLPVEIMQEYDNWRRVRDSEGTEGWVHGSLLSGQRTAMAAPWQKDRENVMIDMRKKPAKSSRLSAKVEPGALLEVISCDSVWCLAKAGSVEAYVDQSAIWGVYPNEVFGN